MRPVSLSLHRSLVPRFILTCGFILGTCVSCARDKSQEAATQTATEQVVAISTKPVEIREVKRTVEMVGTLGGWEEVTVSNEMAGTIEKILVDLGDKVKRGQLLIRFDQREAKLALAQAEANLEAARKALAQAQAEQRDADLNLKRISQLHSEGVISTSQRDVAQTRFDAIEAQVHAREADIDRFRALVDLARKRLSDTEVVAPISGEVRQRLVSIGEGVKEKTPLLHLVITDPLKLQGTVPERFAPEIKIEQPVDVRVEAFAERSFPGLVQRVSPAVDVQTRSLALEAKVPNPEGLLKPGFFAKGLILVGMNPQAVFVPEEAVYSYVGITKAFVVGDGTARERQVKTGIRTDGLVEVTEGLQAGETVATSSLPQLYQGAKVRVVDGKES
ncbi:MAG TPA: efflux RND transporter periplasmic adaptor subunit [Candidatus Binatia bacterium]|nr:efflux RND transporter periplasmic adaptor subunit [Candidatus Binatia bacterium]